MFLNVGSNRAHLRGFVNIDIEPIADVCCDVRWDLPFGDGVFEGVYSEHFIEHIPQPDAVAFLRECRRVTTTGGRIRVATPDLAWVVGRYSADDWRTGDMFSNGYEWVATRAEQLNIAMRHWGHQWVYDEEELTRIGRMAGLEPIGRQERGTSSLSAFSGLETREGSRLVIEFTNPRPDPRVDQPLVSVLIPGFRPTLVLDAIESAVAQTYDNLEIIVGDDSSGDEISAIVADWSARDARIRYQRNPEPGGARRNYYELFASARGDYVKFLNDDDVLHPEAVERFASVLSTLPRVTLVTSHRALVDESGNRLPDDRATQHRFGADCIVSGPSAVHDMLTLGINWIGEPTSAMFRRDDITDLEPELFAFAGRAAIANGDVTLWTRLLARGDLCYLTPSLSLFRRHGSQVQQDPSFRQRGLQGWEQIKFDASRMGLVGPRNRRLDVRELGLRPWWSAKVEATVAEADAVLDGGDPAGALELLVLAREQSGGDPAVADLEARLAQAIGRDDVAQQARDAIDAFDSIWRRPLRTSA